MNRAKCLVASLAVLSQGLANKGFARASQAGIGKKRGV